jgi:hypothetical protein
LKGGNSAIKSRIQDAGVFSRSMVLSKDRIRYGIEAENVRKVTRGRMKGKTLGHFIDKRWVFHDNPKQELMTG